ncbi:MAG: MFS transporter, partial [Natronospirillum sp.]
MTQPLPGQLSNIVTLVICQALFLLSTITVMTFSGIVGQTLTRVPELITLPVAAMMLGTVCVTVPASLLMKRIGRRNGFVIGTFVGGVLGGLVSVLGIALSSFW